MAISIQAFPLTCSQHKFTRLPLLRISLVLIPFVLFIPPLALYTDLLQQTSIVAPKHATIDWLPADFNDCARTSCLLKPPFSKEIHTKVADVSIGHMRQYLQTNTIPEVRQVAGHPFPLPVCSVVGGAPAPVNKSHAPIIDSSIVYRINTRVPEFLAAQSKATALGNRTDIIVLQWMSITGIGVFFRNLSRKRTYSQLAIAKAEAGRKVRKRKPVLLFRLGSIRSAKSWPRAWEKLFQSIVPKCLPLSFVNPYHELEAVKQMNRIVTGKYQMPHGYGYTPSSGIVAIMNALSNCRHVNLFAFNGSTKMDGDYPGKAGLYKGHSGGIERDLVRWLARCTPEENWMCGRLTLYS